MRAEELMPTIPRDSHNSVARFLESRGSVRRRRCAFATDPDYKFELQLGELGVAREIIENEDMSAGESKWKQLGELAMSGGDIELLFQRAWQNPATVRSAPLCACCCLSSETDELAATAKEKARIMLGCLFLLNKIDACIKSPGETGASQRRPLWPARMPHRKHPRWWLWVEGRPRLAGMGVARHCRSEEWQDPLPDFDLGDRQERRGAPARRRRDGSPHQASRCLKTSALQTSSMT